MSDYISAVELRHLLHKIPELKFEEFETTRILSDNIKKMGNVKIHYPLETGLLVEYTVNDGNYLLFRADIDALPIKEATECSFSSQNSNMHACGHDLHMAILYSLICYVTENKVKQNILFLFQPGEEAGGGAIKVIESGILNQFKISKAFALHVTDEYEFGTIASTSGVLFASAHECDIEIFGKSSHVAFPEKGIHAFNVLSNFINTINSYIETSEDKLIFGYGKIESGVARNIIPDYARAECTIRTLNADISLSTYKVIDELLKQVTGQFGAKYKLIAGPLYYEVRVDSELFANMRELLSPKYKFIDCGYKMTGEDFGYFSRLYPSFMFWLGTSKGEYFGLHNEKFLPSDETIKTGLEIYIEILNNMLKNN